MRWLLTLRDEEYWLGEESSFQMLRKFVEEQGGF